MITTQPFIAALQEAVATASDVTRTSFSIRSVARGLTRRGYESSSCRAVGQSILVALLLSGCQSGADPGDQPGRDVVTLDDVHLVPTPDVLARIVDVEPAGDGRVWVLNSVEPLFLALGADGQVERSFGRRGGGPGEFGDPLELVLGPDGEVWAFDLLRNALRPISDDQLSDLELPSESFPPSQLVSFQNAGMGMLPVSPWVQSQGTDFLVARKRPSAPPSGGLGIWHADILRLGLDRAEVSLEPSIAVADLLSDPAGRYPGATTLLPYPIWTVCGDGVLGLYDPLANTLRRFAPDGREEPATALNEERRESVTFDRVFGMVYRLFAERRPGGQAPDSIQMRSVLQEQFTQREGEFADVFPEYADLRCTDDGTFWLQPFHVANGRFERSPEWIRLSRDGSRSEISLPEAFSVYRIEGDRIWGVVIDSLGVPAVAWLDIDD